MKSNKQANWIPRWLKNMPKGWKHPKPLEDPTMTNRMRMQQRYWDRKGITHENN